MTSDVSVRPGGGTRPRTSRWISTEIAALQRKILIDAGHDAAAARVPDPPFKFVGLREVCEKLGLSPSSIYRGIERGTIPKPISLDQLMAHGERVGGR
jgi:predicted DNA-binding transcriptional regulator AlpA